MPGIILFGKITARPIHREGVNADPHREREISAYFLFGGNRFQILIAS